MGRGKLTPKDDPEDRRRIDEVEQTFQPREMRVLSSNPAVKELLNGEEVVVADGTTVTRVQRVGNKLYTVATLTAI